MDPDVAAAFGSAPAAAPAQSSGPTDPDVAAAFAPPAPFVQKPAPPWLVQSDKPLQGAGSGLAQVAGHVLNAPGKWLTTQAVKHGVTNPYAAAAIGVLPDLAEDYALGGRQGVNNVRNVLSGRGLPGASVPEQHPLEGAAQEERARIYGIQKKAEAAGLDLPDASISKPQKVANDLATQDLKLPDGAPLTPKMLAAGRHEYASPGYEGVKALPDAIPLSDSTQATIEDVRGLLPPKVAATLPTTDSITGQQAVNLSKSLRSRANQLDGMQGANANNQLWSEVADAHRDAALAIENDVKSHLAGTGRSQLADAWDAGRVYTAKSYAYEHALDGAGNVRVMDMKRQLLNGEPLSDNAELLATIGAQHPKL